MYSPGLVESTVGVLGRHGCELSGIGSGRDRLGRDGGSRQESDGSERTGGEEHPGYLRKTCLPEKGGNVEEVKVRASLDAEALADREAPTNLANPTLF
jgi:hypothetical protein